MKTKSLKILAAIIVVFFSLNLKASHVLNGDFDAVILKSEPDSVTYSIALTVRAMCDSNAIQLPKDLIVCVYDANTGALVKSGQLLKYDQYKISNCVGFCVTNVQYYATLTVAKRDMYILKTEICCRKSLTNFRNDVNGEPYIGHMFYLKLSSNINLPRPQIELTGLYNLNPRISDTIKYYINDTYADSISVTKVAPFSGASISNNFPDCGSNYSAPKIGPVDYANSFSFQFPFGTQGICDIDLPSSQCVIMSPAKGEFAVALRFAFFKNGVLYYETVREIHTVVSDYVLNNSNQATLSAAALPFPLTRLNWSICPKNLVDVIVEKSDSDNSNFYELAKVGLGYFKIDDNNVGFGRVYYYRLKIFTSQDTFYSNEVKVTFFNKSIHDIRNEELKLSPNPFIQYIHFHGQKPIQEIEILNVNGQSIYKQQLDEASMNFKIDTKELPTGIYIIESTNIDGWKYHHKMVKD